MSKDILSPFQIDYMFLTDMRFHIEDSPSEKMEAGVEVSMDSVELRKDGDRSNLDARVSVSADLHDAGNPDNALMSAAVVMRIGVRGNIGADMGDGEVCRILAANAVSLAYSHARSIVNSAAAESPAGTFIIPGIDPWAVVDEVLDQTEGVPGSK